jgi:hypothetical protein
MAKIYKLFSTVEGDNTCYIGSTTTSLSIRKNSHKCAAHMKPNLRVYNHFNTIGWEHVDIALIESVSDASTLREREQHHMDLIAPSLNVRRAHGRVRDLVQHNHCTFCNKDFAKLASFKQHLRSARHIRKRDFRF